MLIHFYNNKTINPLKIYKKIKINNYVFKKNNFVVKKKII